MCKNYILEFIKGVSIVITILFAILGVASVTHIAEEVYYYENGTKIDAIKYHNEIYLRKGE